MASLVRPNSRREGGKRPGRMDVVGPPQLEVRLSAAKRADALGHRSGHRMAAIPSQARGDREPAEEERGGQEREHADDSARRPTCGAAG